MTTRDRRVMILQQLLHAACTVASSLALDESEDLALADGIDQLRVVTGALDDELRAVCTRRARELVSGR